MSRKRRGQGRHPLPSKPNGGPPDANAPSSASLDSRFTPDRFRTNVFTWTGPGIENIFIDFERARPPKRRGEASDRSDHNR